MSAFVKQHAWFEIMTFAGNTHAGKMEFIDCKGEELIFDSTMQITELSLIRCNIKAVKLLSSDFQKVTIIGSAIGTIEISNPENSSVIYTIQHLKISEQSSINSILISSTSVHQFDVDNSDLREIELKKSTCSVMTFDTCKIRDQIRLLNTRINHQLLFRGSEIEGMFFTEGMIGSLICQECTIADEAELTVHEYHNVRFDESMIKTLVLSGGSCSSAQIVGGQINYLEIGIARVEDLYVGADSKWEIHKMLVNEINLKSYSVGKDCQLKLYNLKVNELFMSAFENHGRLDVADVLIGYCNMANARLSKSIFNNVQFERLELFSAVINESTFSNIIWPAHYQLVEFDSDLTDLLEDQAIKEVSTLHKITMYSKIADAYCQLKSVSLKQNNKFGALQFQMHEMKFQFEIIHLKTFHSGNAGFQKNFKDWLLLGTNRVFSDFGLSWWKPLRALFIVTALYLWWIVEFQDVGISIIYNPCKWSAHSWQIFGKGFQLYLKLLTPIRDGSVSSIEISTNVLFSVFDFLVRIAGSYLIYNFLRGTRKFNFGV